jgi:hypothetical protein
MGLYVRELRSAGLTVDGFDGNPDTPELTENACGVLDLSEPVSFEKPYDWVMSLEVGEHLPPQFEDIYIANLHNSNASGVVLSWALKGQGCFGHFNERDNEYIKARFAELGYTNDIENENILRESSTLPYFKRTIMVFRKA